MMRRCFVLSRRTRIVKLHGLRASTLIPLSAQPEVCGHDETRKPDMSKATSQSHSEGHWRVVRNCCANGNCFECQGALTGRGPVRLVQTDNVSEAVAKAIAQRWPRHAAVAEAMPSHTVAAFVPG